MMIPFRRGTLSGVIDAECADGSLKDVLGDPDRLFCEGDSEIVKEMGNTRTVRFSRGGREFLLKHYRFRGAIHSLRGFFGGSRGAKAARRAELFRQAGIATPRPIVRMERSRLGIPGESYLCYEFFPEAENLTERYRRVGERAFLESKILEGVGRDTARIHEAGLYHGDLKWSNILVTEKTKGIALLIDLDGAGRAVFQREERYARDLGRFLVDLLENMKTPRPAMEVFLRSYLACRTIRSSGRNRFLFLVLVEERVREKLAIHARTRGTMIQIGKGEIAGLLNATDGTADV